MTAENSSTVPGDDYQRFVMDATVTANDLLTAGLECLPILLEYQDKPSAAEAILIVGHALLAQRDHHNEENRIEQSAFRQAIVKQLDVITNHLADLVESADFLAAHPGTLRDVDLEAETIRHKQANVDYDWLKSLLHKALPKLTEGEYLTAHERIASLAGL